MSQEPSDEEKAKRVEKFRKVIGYRKIAGWAVSVVGSGLLVVGIGGSQPMLIVNGILFLGYGLFMVWQSVKALGKLS